jgi:hypothetical protein
MSLASALYYANRDFVHGNAWSRARFIARATTWLAHRLLGVMRVEPAAANGNGVDQREAASTRLQIAVWAGGGLGDLVTAAGYVERLYLEHGCPDIDVFYAKRSYLEFLFHGATYVGRLLPYASFARLQDRYDVVVHVHRTATYEIRKPARVTNLAPEFWWCVHQSTKRNDEFAAHIRETPYLDGDLAKRAGYKNLKRKSLMGYSGAVQFSDDSWVPFSPAIDGLEAFRRFDLIPGRYITIHDGYDTVNGAGGGRSTKQWSLDSWRELILRLRTSFPDYSIVQLGGRNSQRFANVDVDLVGRVGFKEVAWLVKHAACHVDNESGIVRLARELGGRSVVIFGPTDPGFFGFDENTNVLPRRCGNCFWSTREWLKQCPRGLDVPECTHSVTVDDVLTEVGAVVRMRSRETCRLTHAVLFDDAAGETWPAPRAAFATAGSCEALQGMEARHVMQVFKHALPTPTGAHKLALLAPEAGILAQNLRETGVDVVVFSNDLHARARDAERASGAVLSETEMRYGNVHHLCAASASFDVAILTSQAQPSAYDLLALREALRVVRPGGCLVWSLLIAGEHDTMQGADGGPAAHSLQRLAALLHELDVADALMPSRQDVTVSAACLRRHGQSTLTGDSTLLALVIAKEPADGANVCVTVASECSTRTCCLPG